MEKAGFAQNIKASDEPVEKIVRYTVLAKTVWRIWKFDQIETISRGAVAKLSSCTIYARLLAYGRYILYESAVLRHPLFIIPLT